MKFTGRGEDPAGEGRPKVGLSGGGEGGDRVPEPIHPPGRLPSGARAVEGKPFDRPGGEARGAGMPPRVGVAAGHRAPGKWSEKKTRNFEILLKFFDAAGPGGPTSPPPPGVGPGRCHTAGVWPRPEARLHPRYPALGLRGGLHWNHPALGLARAWPS